MTRTPAFVMLCVAALSLAAGIGSAPGTSQQPAPAAAPPAGYAAPQASVVVPYQIARNGGDGVTAEQAKQILTLLGRMPTGDQVERMIESLEAIEVILQGAAEQPAQPQAQPQGRPPAKGPRSRPPAGPTKLQAAQAGCGSCHTPSKQQGGFILFATEDRKTLKPFTNREKKLISEKVELEEMPPKDHPPLTPAAKAALVRW